MSTPTDRAPHAEPLTSDPGYQAFTALRVGFTALPILFGIDKFVTFLTDDWTRYLATQINDIAPGDSQQAMHLVGVVVLPRFGAPLVAAWLGGIIVNLLLVGGYGDVALRDFGLMLAALVLTRLAWAYSARVPNRRS